MKSGRDARARTPLAPWFPDAASLARTRKRLGLTPRVFVPRDRSWGGIAPPFAEVIDLVRIGLPFQIAAHRRYDRSGRFGRLHPALATGKTVFIPQIHQVLPRVMRFIVALRTAFVGTGRDECSFLFLVEGRGREGLGLHHDGDVVSFWLQLEGRRTVTLGPPVPRGTPQELPDVRARARGFTTLALSPGTLLYLPPRTPHRVVCYGRSLALSLTWSIRRRRSSTPVWDVASGRVRQRPRASRSRLSTQVPVSIRTYGRTWTLGLPDGERLDVPAVDGLGPALTMMADFRADALGAALPALREHGVVGPEELPQVIVPDAPRALDGWRFA